MQPIDTAPRDGRQILGYAGGDYAVVYWTGGEDGYWNLAVCGAFAEDGEWNPTHWDDLPPPPSHVSATGSGGPTAPWPDYAGNPIHEGDRIVHPSGESGVVVYLPAEERPTDQWRVRYDGDGGLSRLAMQIGDKGMAVVRNPEHSA